MLAFSCSSSCFSSVVFTHLSSSILPFKFPFFCLLYLLSFRLYSSSLFVFFFFTYVFSSFVFFFNFFILPLFIRLVIVKIHPRFSLFSSSSTQFCLFFIYLHFLLLPSFLSQSKFLCLSSSLFLFFLFFFLSPSRSSSSSSSSST